jgi:hypothetical protein
MNPIERLAAAGLLDPERLTERDREKLMTLIDDEVDYIIALDRRLGRADLQTARANFPL